MSLSTSRHARRERPSTGAAPIAVDRASEEAASDLVLEMRRRWDAGGPPAAEELLTRRPDLSQRPEAAVEVIYEEYCLRQSAGEQGVEQDILRRFPQWAGPLRVMLDCHRRLLESDRDRPQFPAAGDVVGDFKLLAELARGSRGRVFHAAQTTLADRPVVLKITPLEGAEHLSLARLQHTHIVPLYGAFDDAARNVRVLCMPYFGRATLASLLESLASIPPAARTGKDVLDAIDRLQDPSAPAPAPSAARQMLARVSYVGAMCWVTACLAEALQFAHERGLVHLDLKPSNVLLAGDGQPMLLDFHLAREPIRPNGPLPENFGGTPPYMPPEQQQAMRAILDGTPVKVTVDARADVYALGAMLHETLGGRLPTAGEPKTGTALEPKTGTSLNFSLPRTRTALNFSPPRVNRQVSLGLSDIITRCVAPRAQDRYADALALADDLRRHLTDQPLAGVPNRSIAERYHKWRRRRPASLRVMAMLLLIVAAATALLAGAWSDVRDRRQQAQAALLDGHRQLGDGQFAEAVRTFQRGLALVERLPMERDLSGQLRDQLAAARRLHLAGQIHEVADQIRVLYGGPPIEPAVLRSLMSRCDALWQRRETIMESLGPAHDPDLPADLQDIAIFAAGAQVRLSTPPGSNEDQTRAARLLDEAQAMFGPSVVLDHERQSLGLATTTPTASAASTREARPQISKHHAAWEHYAVGRALLVWGNLPQAADELTAALQLEPAGRWPNFYYGQCAYRMGRYGDAVTAFSVCIGAAPNVAGYFYNRALAYSALGQEDSASRDFDRARRLDPAFAPP